jgi:Subtilase family
MPDAQPESRPPGKPDRSPRADPFPIALQTERFLPKFDRLRDVLARDPEGLSLRTDPEALAPERLLVFEVRGSVSAFANAIRKIEGFVEWVGEEEIVAEEGDKNPVAYLLVPDVVALRSIESLWRRWQRHETLPGWAPWRDVFNLLKDLRRWGPQDRLDPFDAQTLADEIEERGGQGLIRLEIELVFRENDQQATDAEQTLVANVQLRQGRLINQSRIKEIAYHAVLIELPITAIRDIIALKGLAGIDPVMHIRPQSIASTVEVADSEKDESPIETARLGEPILALLDGVPLARHRLLERHLVVGDVFGLEPASLVADRRHGTAMASLIVHGDRNRKESPILRKIHVVPVVSARNAGADEEFPGDRLIVDMIYTAVRGMREGNDAAAPGVLIVNLSLGNPRQAFHGRLSAWAKLLDRLAYHYGILFVISAGNADRFAVPGFATRMAFEDAEMKEGDTVNPRSTAVLGGLAAVMGERRIISPAESVNGVTVGGSNSDAVPAHERQAARTLIDPYPEVSISNPSSRLGPGYLLAVKPDILMPGARERLLVITSDGSKIEVKPAGPQRPAGLKVAATPRDGQECEGYTNGSSAAAALASRTCHRIHDALEAAYGEAFLALPHRERAVLLKALLAHTAQWPTDTVALIQRTLNHTGKKHHSHQKDDVRRFLGYGIVDADSAVACADDRATFWVVGEVKEREVVRVSIPIPTAISGKARPHIFAATLAWFTPTHVGAKAYRAARLILVDDEKIESLGVSKISSQPNVLQGNKGTLISRRWEGSKAPNVARDTTITLRIQREPDLAGMRTDDPMPFGLAVTLEMSGVVEIYEEVRQRLAVQPQVRTR